jgi:hypothetical protein
MCGQYMPRRLFVLWKVRVVFLTQFPVAYNRALPAPMPGAQWHARTQQPGRPCAHA